MSEAGLRRQGKSGPDRAPDIDLREQLVGGVVRQVPDGVDPGFEYNPGQRWLSGGRPFEPVASADQVGAFANRALAGELPAGTTVPIAEVPAATAEALGIAEGTRARLSVETIRSHSHRAEISAHDYQEAARQVIEAGDVHVSEQGRLAAIATIGGEPHRIGFKVTRLGEFLITTMHRTRPKQIARVRRGQRLGR